MSEWWSVIAIFWIAYLLDGLRRSARAHTLVRRAAPAATTARHAGLHLLPPVPWAWRFRADDPPFALSPEGLCNQPLATAARPAAPAPFTAVWRWEQIESVDEKQGWLVVNGRLFGPAAPAWPAAELHHLATALAPLPPAAREARLRRWLDLRLRPAHWRRRLALARARTATVAATNTATLLACAALTAIACLTPETAEYEAAPRILALLPPLSLFAGATYLLGIAQAVRAARRLRRWLQPGATRAIFAAACFPPQGLRWRRLLTELCPPAPHPLLAALAAPGRALHREYAFATLADTRWPLPLPETAATAPGDTPVLAAAAPIRAWHAAEFDRRVRRWLALANLDADALLAPPPRDHASCRAYCPRCHSQFVRADGRCPHGIPLQPLPPATRPPA